MCIQLVIWIIKHGLYTNMIINVLLFARASVMSIVGRRAGFLCISQDFLLESFLNGPPFVLIGDEAVCKNHYTPCTYVTSHSSDRLAPS